MSKVLIYSDVHGNLPAFETMLKHVGPCDAYICLGDLVNYGPWSNECVDLALSLQNSKLLLGNHEEAFILGYYPGENKLVKLFFEMTYNDFARLDEIKKFEADYRLNDLHFIHTINNQYIYPDTTIVLDDNYVIGHSHHQFVYHSDNFVLYNAGSVGQNRGFINVANFLILDTTTGVFELSFVKFDLGLIIQKMSELKYPEECLYYYKHKKQML